MSKAEDLNLQLGSDLVVRDLGTAVVLKGHHDLGPDCSPHIVAGVCEVEVGEVDLRNLGVWQGRGDDGGRIVDCCARADD